METHVENELKKFMGELKQYYHTHEPGLDTSIAWNVRNLLFEYELRDGEIEGELDFAHKIVFLHKEQYRFLEEVIRHIREFLSC